MTVVPKKKSDSRSTANNNNSKPAARAASSAASASGGEPVTATKSEPVDQVEGQQYQDQQQQHQSPYVQCSTSAGDSMNNQEEVNNHSAHKTAAASNGDENDRRQLLPHQQPQQHHQQHQHSKNMNSKADSESNVNHVILITVINPHYPITCDLINQICSAYGTVKRIVIFKKNGVQAMVEFDSVEEAKKAKNFLNGCDVYSGCCTLKIEFAKPVRLNVHRNDSGSWDYTNPNLASGPNNQQQANSTETGLNDNQQQQPNHHHHQQQHHHHLQQGPTVVGQHGAYLHGMNAPHQHLVRGGPGMGGRRTGGSVGGGTGGSLDAMASHQSSSGGHNQHFQSTQHMHHPGNHQQQQQQHSKQSIPPTLGGQHGGGMHQTTAGYVMGQPPQLDQSEVNSADTSDTFHQQDTSGFNVPRSSGGPVGGGGQHQQNQFVGIDTSMPTSATSTTTHINPHAVHSGNVYPPRQDGSHPHNQSHHQHQSHHQTHQLNNRGGGLPGSGLSRAGHGHNPSFPQINTANALMAGASHLAAQGTVMMVYGLSLDWMNCDRLFNLFCLYGNVVRIKFLKSKEGCAMVQMGDVIAVDRCFSSLNKVTLFGNELQISYSKQALIHDVMQPFLLPDNTPSFKDFMGNKNNRFRNPEVASKNRILPPSRVLHFFNAPFGILEEEMMTMFQQVTGYKPVTLKIFTPRVDNAKSCSGLVTFRDPAEATEALVLCNHMNLPKAGGPHPYILRLCFSPPTYC